MGEPRVYNKHHGNTPADAVYVGRGSPWGNPFKIGEPFALGYMTRDDVCDMFESEVLPTLDLTPLRGKSLVCFCAPKRCHADALLREANRP